MLQLSYLANHTQEAIEKLAKKNFDAQEIVAAILSLDQSRRSHQANLDQSLNESNALAKEIGSLLKENKTAEAQQAKIKTAELKEQVKGYKEKLDADQLALDNLLVTLPNIPHHSVPQGKTPEQNEIIATHGTIPTLHSEAQPHWELCQKYKLIDFELGVKITGAGFPVYRGKGAKLQRALINFFLDNAEQAGYLEIQPPILINKASGFGTGQLPDKDGQMYYAGIDELYLIPTAEVPVTNIYRDVIVKESELPIKNAAYTPCFRREAGSYGKDVRGLNRLHQFDKVEIVQVAHPKNSYEVLEEMQQYVASLLQKLGLPYRILRLCGGDMSFTSALTYDFEVYSTAQERWLEVSSVSNFETYQTNRLKLRYKSDTDGKNHLAHTLNGSALALPRIVASILENYQTPDGITVPAALVPYTGFELIN